MTELELVRRAKAGEIHVMNADGSGETRLTDRPGLKGLNAWSPNGKRMLLNVAQQDRESGFEDEETWEIYVMNSDGADVRRLTDDPAADMLPRWSPDGNWISFTSRRPVSPERRLKILRAKVKQEGVDVSEDTLQYMAKQGANAGEANVWMMKADGSEVQHVIEGWRGGWSACTAQR